jgi:hypothetical protein
MIEKIGRTFLGMLVVVLFIYVPWFLGHLLPDIKPIDPSVRGLFAVANWIGGVFMIIGGILIIYVFFKIGDAIVKAVEGEKE